MKEEEGKGCGGKESGNVGNGKSRKGRKGGEGRKRSAARPSGTCAPGRRRTPSPRTASLQPIHRVTVT